MRPAEDIKRMFNESKVKVDPDFDEKAFCELSEKLSKQQEVRVQQNIWRIIMRNKITKIAAAVAIVIGILCITVFEKPVPPAYAIEQTIKAIDTIRTVHFKAEFFKQGDVECWMQFDGKGKEPTHLCLFWPSNPIRKVETPKGPYAYNTATNRIYRTIRDERKKDWYVDFSGFFKKALKSAQKDKSVEISNEKDPGTQQDIIIIDTDEGGRKCRFVVDPETKLPLSFATTEIRDFLKYYRQTIVVRNMSFIEYNKPAPDGLFDIPPDAEEVYNEHDVFVHPGVGMPVGQMDEEQACKKLVNEVIAAMNARDWEKAAKLFFPIGPPPKEMEAKLPQDKSKPMIEILEFGQAYEQGDYWYIPCKIKEYGGKIKQEDIPVKFYEFDGERYCMVMFPD